MNENVSEKNNINEIRNFWYTLFPELKDRTQLSKILHAISNKTEDEYIIDYLEEVEKSFSIDKIFKEYENNECITKLKETLDKLKSKCRWVYFFEPILSRIYKQLVECINNNSIIENSEVFFEDIFMQILQKMVNISYRTIVQEITLTKKEGKLKGNNSKERNRYFTDCMLRDREYLMNTYKSYSELIRILCVVAETKVDFIEQILTHTEEEMIDIKRIFFESKDIGKLISIQMGKGDTHNNGQTVCKLQFEKQVLIYKPRDLGMEKKFAQLISWMESVNENFVSVYCGKVHSNGISGWMEFIENEECKSEQDISDFYFKMGELLCIIYSFNAKDFHYENVIAKGNSPVLIDLETLFHVILEEEIDDINMYIYDRIYNSVIGSTFLPTLFQNNNTNQIIEVGALGKCKTQVSPFKTQVLKNTDSDEICIDTENKILPRTKNFPVLNGEGIGCAQFLGQIRDGFKQIYIWIMKNKQLYLDKVNMLFKNEKCRVICKNTNLYTQLLETGNHPSLLYNRIDREVYFHRLGLVITFFEDFQESNLYRQEIKFMLNEDIPMFYTYVNSKDVKCGNDESIGVKCIDTAMNETKRKVLYMDQLDLKRQIALINESFIGSKIKTDLISKTNVSFHDSQKSCLENDRLEIITKMADLCMERAFAFRNEVSWMGMLGFGDDYYKIVPVGFNLYRGNSGISIFFYETGKILQDNTYTEFAKQVTVPIIRNIEREIQTRNIYSYGAFTGFSGELYLLGYLYRNRYFESYDLEKLIAKAVDVIYDDVDKIKGCDVLYGLAGVLGVVLMLYNMNRYIIGKEKCLMTADKIVERIMHDYVNINSDNTVTWTENEDIGYAHGNAGVMTQLIRYYEITRKPVIIDYVKRSLLFERIHKYDEITERWKPRNNTHYYSWCNGIGGLLLCKLKLLEILSEDKTLTQEINIIISQLKIVGFGNDSSICHGDIGSISIMAYTAEKLEKCELQEQCDIFKNNYAENYILKSWNKYEYTEDWGLMTGFTGLGLGLYSNSENLISLLYLK